jgi:oxygen-independent coproporphyrinogen-3 oxidase
VVGKAADRPVHTIYLGGGTPSLLSAAQVGAILHTIRGAFSVVSDPEISLEVNPENSDQRYFDALRPLGVNRLSIGMQSIQPAELRMYARQHGAKATGVAVTAARRAGFDNISLDLIYGAPYQTLRDWASTVEAALALVPDHASLYALQLEPGTPLAAQVDQGRLPRPDDDLAADMYELADGLLSAAGFEQYEISSFAKPGRECTHNRQYWVHADYLGLGAGAHGFARDTRYVVTARPQTYIERLTGPTRGPIASYPLSPAAETHELINAREAMDETMITGLRLLNEGVTRAAFERRFGVTLDSAYPGVVASLVEEGLVTDDGLSIRLTKRARLIANQALIHFMRG